MEYLAALALNDGRATSRTVARTLARSLQDLSTLRDDLIREGDVYSPRRGHLALAVPIFGPFILDHYETARELADTRLLSLTEMTRNRDVHTTGDQDLAPTYRQPNEPAAG